MTTSNQISNIAWDFIHPPLSPRLAVARGGTALRLAQLLRVRPKKQLQQLRGACGKDFFYVLGESHTLPWIDGIEYLGVCPSTPGLYVPVHLRPRIDGSLFGRIIKNQYSDLSAAIGLLLNPMAVFTLSASEELSPDVMPGIINTITGSAE